MAGNGEIIRLHNLFFNKTYERNGGSPLLQHSCCLPTLVGLLNINVMAIHDEKTEQEQQENALQLLKNLLKENDAKGIREDLNQLFYGYISSEFSDDKRERNNKYSTYLSLIEFLTKLSKLNKINRWIK